MPSIEALLLEEGGTFRRRRVKIGRVPRCAVNNRERHAYHLGERPTYWRGAPRVFRDFDQYLDAGPPPPSPKIGKLAMIGEDGCMWPWTGEPLPDLVRRRAIHADNYEEAFELAEHDTSRAESGNPLMSAFLILCLSIAAVCVLLVAVVFAQSQWGGA